MMKGQSGHLDRVSTLDSYRLYVVAVQVPLQGPVQGSSEHQFARVHLDGNLPDAGDAEEDPVRPILYDGPC